MKNPAAIRAKVRKDHPLNLSELAVASGYDRGALSRMNLPLQIGKISLSDFKRIMRKRQDLIEAESIRQNLILFPTRPPFASHPANARPLQEAADKFYGSSSKSAAQSA